MTDVKSIEITKNNKSKTDEMIVLEDECEDKLINKDLIDNNGQLKEDEHQDSKLDIKKSPKDVVQSDETTNVESNVSIADDQSKNNDNDKIVSKDLQQVEKDIHN